MTTALTTCSVIKAIVLQLIADINRHTLWVIQISHQGISRDKTSATVLDFKLLWCIYGGCCTDRAATLLPCIQAAMQ
jgi:hypothetical protein